MCWIRNLSQNWRKNKKHQGDTVNCFWYCFVLCLNEKIGPIITHQPGGVFNGLWGPSLPCFAPPQLPRSDALTHRVTVFSFRSCSHCCCGTRVSGVVFVGGTPPGGFHIPDHWGYIPNGSDWQHLDQLHMLLPLQSSLLAAHHHLHVRMHTCQQPNAHMGTTDE